MARKVKCKATGEWGTSETFYKPEDVKSYFKDKETYEAWLKEKSVKKVRCFLTKEYGTNETFYRPEDGPHSNHYFKNKEIYDEWRSKAEIRKKINDMIADFTGYYNGEVFPTVVPKKLKELEEKYDIFTVYDTIIDKKNDIQYAMDSMEFNSEYGKCSYLMAIIVNNINDVSKRKKRKEKLKAKEEIEANSDYFEFKFMPRPVTNKNDRDISQFLEDGSWN